MKKAIISITLASLLFVTECSNTGTENLIFQIWKNGKDLPLKIDISFSDKTIEKTYDCTQKGDYYYPLYAEIRDVLPEITIFSL